MLLAGLALLQVTRNLGRRKALAWWVAVAALSVSLLSHVGRAFDLHHSLVAALLLAYLVVFRRRFTARSDPASLRQALLMAPVLAATVWVFGAVGLADLRDQFTWDAGNTPGLGGRALGPADPRPRRRAARPSTPPASWERCRSPAGRRASTCWSSCCGRSSCAGGRRRRRGGDRPGGARARPALALGLRRAGRQAPPGRRPAGAGSWPTPCAGTWRFAAGDPLCAEADLEACARDWLEHCRHNGWTPCVYEAAEEALAVYRRLGLRSLKMAEEAIVDLGSFSLAGGKRAALRSMVHKATRMGLAVRRYDRAAATEPAIDEQLEEISEEWLAEKRLGEMGFSLGRFSLESLDEAFVFLCLDGDRVIAFTTWRPYRGGRAALLDLMRKRKDAPSGTMDLLVARSLEELRAAGLEEASLANAPLANVGEPRGGLEKGVALLFENLNAFYGYKNLFQFKKKFAPRWEGRYLVYPRGVELPRVAYALTGVHGAGGLRRLVLGR